MVEDGWGYHRRAHEHITGLGAEAVAPFLFVGLYPATGAIKSGIAILVWFGTFCSPAFWTLPAFQTRAMGAQAEKEFLEMMAQSGAGAGFAGLTATNALGFWLAFRANAGGTAFPRDSTRSAETPVVALALIAPILGLPPLFTVVHLVWLELIIHPVAALIFEAEPAPPDLMTVPPRDPNEPLLSPPDALRSFGSGVALAAVVLGAYWSFLTGGEAHARGVALATLLLGYLFLVQAERAVNTPWWLLPFPTGGRFWIVGGCVAASLPLVLYVPVLASTLHIVALGAHDWIWAFGLVAVALGWRIPGRALLGAK